MARELTCEHGVMTCTFVTIAVASELCEVGHTTVSLSSEDLLTLSSQREELTLDEMVANALPRDHPMYPHIASSLEEVKRNPFWRPEQKQKFVGGLLKEVTR
jgi:hypothetical protein